MKGKQMQVEYSQDKDIAYFDGLKFRRDKDTGYYLNAATHERLHRYVWEYNNGEIPDGFCIHHIDEDKNHNDIENLACIPESEHATLHGKERAEKEYDKMIRNLNENARPKASEWHKSEAGRQWARDHWKETIGSAKQKKHVCQCCGKIFYSKKDSTKYCSNKCKSQARRQSGVDNETRICPICGKEFVVNKYSKKQCCSKECAYELRWHKRQTVMG